jgi:hypothetical protein
VVGAIGASIQSKTSRDWRQRSLRQLLDMSAPASW